MVREHDAAQQPTRAAADGDLPAAGQILLDGRKRGFPQSDFQRLRVAHAPISLLVI
jgi:hypothetical protein